MPAPPYEVIRRPVVVWSDGLRLAADVFTPEARSEPRPAILLCHGWGGLRRSLNALYAPFFAQAGYVVLTFDYRTWGDSDGKLSPEPDEPMLVEPGERNVRVRVVREVVDPVDHVTDARAGFAYLIGEPGVDPSRVGLFGSSYGAGHVLSIAGADPRVRAVVAQIGGYGHPDDPGFIEQARQLETAKARGELQPPFPQEPPAEDSSLRGSPDAARLLLHASVEMARFVRVPTLFIDADDEEYNRDYPQFQGAGVFEIVRHNGVSERRTFPCSHYRLYDEYLEPARRLALDWFETHL